MKNARVIVLSSVTAGGKTTLINQLHQEIPNSKIISFDDYSIDALPSAPPLTLILEEPEKYVNQFDLTDLMTDFFKARDEYEVILLDFPFGYRHENLTKYIDLVIYLKTPLDIAFARQIIRDYAEQTTEDILNWAKTYLDFARPIFLAHEKYVSETADILLDGELSLGEKTEMVKKEIELLS